MKYSLALACLIASLNVWAGIGVVSDSKGTACSIERAKQKLPGGVGASIESMDTYVTGGCVSNITFKDDTKVKVTENSRLLIDDFVFDPKKSDAGKLTLKVGMGTVRYASGQIAKNNPQSVNIKTPTASIAVRGTDFNMTVDEAGQSLVILVPSCKPGEKIKEYELEENLCKVGQISVTTLAGTVTLDKAFEGTYVTSANLIPTAPVIINTIEGKISNNLIIAKPSEIQKAGKDNSKSKRDQEEEEAADQARQLQLRIAADQAEQPRVTIYTFASGAAGCNPAKEICVKWEKADALDMQSKGKGTAFRSSTDHYAEVKTQGYESNSTIIIAHDDAAATAIIGSGEVGGNVVIIKQTTGVLQTK